MSILMALGSFISKLPLWTYIVIGLASICLWQHMDVLTLRGDIAKTQLSSQAAIEANSTNQATIKSLQEDDLAWKQKCTIDAQMAQEDKQQLQNANIKIATENMNLKQSLAKAYEANKVWANGPVDPEVESQLRHSLGLSQGAH